MLWPALVAVVLLLPGVAAQEPGDAWLDEDAAECLTLAHVSQQASCVVLYAHPGGSSDRAPLNVGRPVGPAVAAPAGGQALGAFGDAQRFVLEAYGAFLPPGSTEAPDPSAPRLSPEVPSLVADLALSDIIPPRVFLYASIDGDTVGPLDGPASAGGAPCLSVRATLEGADGVPVARGAVLRTVASPSPGSHVEAPCPSGGFGNVAIDEGVTEIEVPLDWEPGFAFVLPRGALRAVVEWDFVRRDGAPDPARLHPPGFRVHMGADAPTRLVLGVTNPVVVDGLGMLGSGTFVHLRVAATSPLGSYDVDPQATMVRLLDGVDRLVVGGVGAPVARYPVQGDAASAPVEVTIPWDLEQANLSRGVHILEVLVPNWQHGGAGREHLAVVIGPGGGVVDEAVPSLLGAGWAGPGVVAFIVAFLLGALAVAALWVAVSRPWRRPAEP